MRNKIDDYAVPATAVNPLCGNDTCANASAYNQGSLSPRIQKRIQMGRTMLDAVQGTWGLQVKQTKMTCDASGQLTQVDGPRRDVSDIIRYSWSATAPWQLVSVQRPSLAMQTFSGYHVLGRATVVTDFYGQQWNSTVDGLGRNVTQQIPGIVNAQTQSYFPSGRLKSVTEPHGTSDVFAYDADGNVSSISRQPSLAVIDASQRFEYMKKRLFTDTLTQGPATVRLKVSTYDESGRLNSLSQGTGEQWGYDNAGRVAWRRNSGAVQDGGYSHRYAYDVFGQLTQVEQKFEGRFVPIAQLLWDTHGNLAAVTDSKGVRIEYTHDDFGRTVEVRSSDMGRRRFVYDEADNVIAELNANGVLIRFRYDADNRLIEKKYESAGLETYSYEAPTEAVRNCASGTLPVSNAANRLARVTDAVGTWYFGYTPDGKPAFEALVATNSQCAKVIQFTYLPDGRLASQTYPSGAVVELQYPSNGELFAERPKGLVLLREGVRKQLLSDMQYTAGELTAYSTSEGKWSLSRDTGGFPDRVEALDNKRRRQSFSTPNKWGAPDSIEEFVNGLEGPELKHTFVTNNLPALSEMTGPTYAKQLLDYLLSGDRLSENGAAYCYESGTHRLAWVQGKARLGYSPAGEVTQYVTPSGTRSLCYGATTRLERVVGRSGEVSDIVSNFRNQRSVEVWPLNGLRQDFRIDQDSRLMVELGVASLKAQYPRPIREYVWVGMHPVAALESGEAENGTSVPKGVTYLYSGQLGEVLTEVRDGGPLLRQYEYTPFGRRREYVTNATQPGNGSVLAVNGALFFNPPEVSKQATAFRFQWADDTLKGCRFEAIDFLDQQTVSLGVSVIAGAQGFSPWYPAGTTDFTFLLGCNVDDNAKVPLVVETQEKAVTIVPVGDASASPYPPGAEQKRYTLSSPTFLELTGIAVASCDELQVRDAQGAVLWQFAKTGFFGGPAPTLATTTQLQGEVLVGIWGTGCNSTELKAGFTVSAKRELQSKVAREAPVPMTLPGQRVRYDGLVDNWNRYYAPELGRYLSVEPMVERAGHVAAEVDSGRGFKVYAYAGNMPGQYTDTDGLRVNLTGISNAAQHETASAVNARLRSCPTLVDYFKSCFGKDPWTDNTNHEIGSKRSLFRDATANTNYVTQSTMLSRSAFGANTAQGEANLGASIAHELSHQMSLSTYDGEVYLGFPEPQGKCTANAFERLAKCILEKGCANCTVSKCEEKTGVVFGPGAFR